MLVIQNYRNCRSLRTPPRLTFQARLLHNQEGANAEKGGFRKISSRAFFRRIGRCSHPLGYSNRARKVSLGGCAETPILTVETVQAIALYILLCVYSVPGSVPLTTAVKLHEVCMLEVAAALQYNEVL